MFGKNERNRTRKRRENEGEKRRNAEKKRKKTDIQRGNETEGLISLNNDDVCAVAMRVDLHKS